MRKSFVPTLLIAAFSAALPAEAAFTLFENFDGLTSAGLNGQTGWTANTNASVVDTGGGDKVASLATGGTGNLSNSKGLGSLTILNTSSSATVYWNFTISAAGAANNWNFIVTDTGAHPGNTGNTSEVQFNYDGASGNPFRANTGGTFVGLSLDGMTATNFLPIVAVTYNGWFEIDNTTDTYRIYLQSDGDARIATRTQMLSSDTLRPGGTFTFRNSGLGVQPNDLNILNFGSGSSGSVVRFDDFYVDTAGFNPTNPVAVPEPASVGFLLLAGLFVSSRRRR